MDKDIKIENNNNTVEQKTSLGNIPHEEQVQAIRTTEFVKETIKQRPINRKRLTRRLLLTISMAIIFGLVACLTFLILEPIINQRLNPVQQEAPLENITFVEESVEEETKPEDMIVDESELQNVTIIEQVPLDDDQIEQVLNKMELGIDEYLSLSSVVTDMIDEISKSVVNVVGITKDTDWFNDSYDNKDVSSGVIIADNGRDLLVLTDLSDFAGKDNLEVSFYDGRKCQANLVMDDSSTGLAVVAVYKARMHLETIESVKIIEMGTSSNKNLNGIPVVALGRPVGIANSTGIGYISSYDSLVNVSDANYKLLTTDIVGSRQASGIIVNAKGQLIGIINMKHNPKGMENVICGLGISELKRLIEKMSNGLEIPYLGVYGSDVTEEISKDLDIPQGVYVTKLDMDSPLLEIGVKSGDIIVRFDSIPIFTFQDMNNRRLTMNPEDEIEIEVMRQGLEGYTSMIYTVPLGHQN